MNLEEFYQDEHEKNDKMVNIIQTRVLDHAELLQECILKYHSNSNKSIDDLNAKIQKLEIALKNIQYNKLQNDQHQKLLKQKNSDIEQRDEENLLLNQKLIEKTAEYRKMQDQKDKEILNLQKSITNIQKSSENYKNQLDSLSENNTILTQKVSDLESDFEEKEKQIQKFSTEKSQLETLLKEQKENYENQLKDTKEKLENQIKEDKLKYENDLTLEKEKVTKLQSENETLKLIQESQKSEISTLKQNAKITSQEIFKLKEDLKNQIDSLISTKDELSKSRNSEEEMRLTLERERKAVIEQQMKGENEELLKSLQDENLKTKNELTLKIQEIETQKDINQQLQKKIELINKEIETSFESRIQSLQQIVNSLKEENEKMKNSVEDSNKEKEKLQNEINSLNSKLADQIESNSKKDNQLEIIELERKFEEEKDSLKQANDSLTDKLNGLNLATDILNSQIEDLTNKLNQSNEENLNNKKLIDSLNSENKQYLQDKDEFKAKYDSLENTFNITFLDLENKKNEITAIQERIESLLNENKNDKELIAKMEKDKIEIDHHVTDLLKKIEENSEEIKNKSEEIIFLKSSGESNNSNLKEQIIQQKQEINKLTNELSRYKGIESELQKVKNTLLQKEGIENRNNELTNQNLILQKEHAELLSIAGTFNVEIFDLRDHLLTVKEKNEQYIEKLSELSACIESLKNSLKNTEKQSNEQFSSFENVVAEQNQQHLDEIKRITKVYEDEIDRIKKTNLLSLEKLNKEISDLQNQSQIEKNHLGKIIESMKNDDQIEKLKQQLNEKNLLIDNLQKLLEDSNPNSDNIHSRKVDFEINNIEIDRLKNQITEYTNEINQIKQNYSEEIEKLRESINVLTLTAEELQSQNNDFESNNSQLTNENISLKSQVKDAKSFLAIIGPLNGEIYDLRADLQSSATRVRQIKSDNRSLKFEVQRLNNEISILQSTLEQKELNILNLQKRQENFIHTNTITTNTNGLDNSKETIENMKAEIAKLYDELSERRKLDGEIETLENEREEMIKDIGLFEESIYELNKKNLENLNTISKLRSEMYDRLNSIEDLKLEIRESDENIAELINQVSSARIEEEKAKQELEQLKFETQKVNLEVNKLNETNVKLNERINYLKQTNSALKQENTNLSRSNNQLTLDLQKNNKEKDMMSQRLSQNEQVNEAIEQLRSKALLADKRGRELEKDLENAKKDNNHLAELLESSTADKTTIRKLEDEKLELLSRVSLLEGQLQLRAVKMKDEEIMQLEEKIEKLTKQAAHEIELSEKVKRLEEENETYKAERDALDLRSAELESNTVSLEVYEDSQKQIKQLHEMLNDQKEEMKEKLEQKNEEIEKIKIERDSVSLQNEYLTNLAEKTKKEYNEAEDQIKKMKSHQDELQNKITDFELKTTTSDIENIMGRRESIRLDSKISELEVINSSLLQEKAKLEETIADLHKRHTEEIQALSARVLKEQQLNNQTRNQTGSNDQIENETADEQNEFTIISNLNQQISELAQKLRIAEAKLGSEAAEHLNTKKSLVYQQTTINAGLEAKLRSAETNFSGLVKAMTNIFGCQENIASIITAAGRAKGQSKLTEDLLTRVKRAEKDLVEARREPNLLRQKIRELNMYLELEKQKSSNLALKSKSANHFGINDYETSNIEVINQTLVPLTVLFLRRISNHKSSSVELQNKASVIAEQLENGDFGNENTWNSFADTILMSQFNASRINTSFFSDYMAEIDQKVSNLHFHISSLDAKLNYVQQQKLIKQINSQNVAKKDQQQNLTLSKKKATSTSGTMASPGLSLYQRSLKDRTPTPKSNTMNMNINTNSTVKSNFNSSFKNNTYKSSFTKTTNKSPSVGQPVSNIQRKDKTPVHNSEISKKKGKSSPFRTPLGNLDNSNILSFIEDTPDYKLQRKTMSKIPVHHIPSGVSIPESRNYH
ncbi:hypothetical protein TRFO_04325 [Tritrichomonas foetus]|uniref:Uncharacterized protein n=1 Tax=Tritrichomonas foetus TaxID=1144522 RepID=A0A1J4KFV3_9EUKA|nr:hypothetical protein TRFO_04325 [Tritrichomonas foetus]|eukprot:OHT10289.1 hypothetical protein TRFO_04325 [Tritrichomonas foetus]